METITCIICPMGCQLEVSLEQTGKIKKVLDVKGNACKRGPEYVQKELLNPTRTLTTTAAVIKGSMKLVPVKTEGEVAKPLLLPCMEIIRRAVCTAPVKRGQVVIQDILGTGVDVIACANVEKV